MANGKGENATGKIAARTKYGECAETASVSGRAFKHEVAVKNSHPPPRKRGIFYIKH